MDLRPLADKTERERETERVSHCNLLAWQRPGAGDLHTTQAVHGSRQLVTVGSRFNQNEYITQPTYNVLGV